MLGGFSLWVVSPMTDSQQRVCRSLEQEQSLRRKAELESAQYKIKLQVVTNKYGQAQQELQVFHVFLFKHNQSAQVSLCFSLVKNVMLIICLLSLVQELRALITETSRNLFSSTSSSSSHVLSLSQRADGSRSAQYSFSKAVLVSQAGGCRVLSYCEPLSCLLASQPSPHTTLVPGETSFFPFDKCDSLSLTPDTKNSFTPH